MRVLTKDMTSSGAVFSQITLKLSMCLALIQGESNWRSHSVKYFYEVQKRGNIGTFTYFCTNEFFFVKMTSLIHVVNNVSLMHGLSRKPSRIDATLHG